MKSDKTRQNFEFMTETSNIFLSDGKSLTIGSEDLPILCSISGGKTSGFMAIYLRLLYPNREMIFVFANTGREREETLIFLKRIDEKWNLGIIWLEADVNEEKGKGTSYKVVDFETASRNGEPFESVIKKYGLPSKLFRHCTRELKDIPIHKYAKRIFEQKAFFKWLKTNYIEIYPYPSLEDYHLTTLYSRFIETYNSEYLTAIGIRADERHRISNKKPLNIYPLADMNCTKTFINDWWSRQSFNLELNESEGNCDDCFLKSKRKRVELIKNEIRTQCNPTYKWWSKMETLYTTDRQPCFDVRNGVTVEDLEKIAKEEMQQGTLFDFTNDVSFDCFCKST